MARPSVRQQLVEASLEVFRATGYNGTSIQDLTDAAGVPKGSFYNHFKGKEDIALEALRLYLAQNGLEALTAQGVPPLERLAAHFDTRWAGVRDRGYTAGCFLGAMSSEIADTHERARAAFAAVFAGWSAAIAAVIREAQQDGIAAGEDADRLARFILNAWQGALVRMKAVKSEEPYEDFRHIVFGQVLRAPQR